MEVESKTIKNPVNGNEAHPGSVLPEGIIVKKADLGCSKVFRTSEGVAMDHRGQYTAVGRSTTSSRKRTAGYSRLS